MIYKTWVGVKQAKQEEINTASYTTAQLASLFYSYIQAKAENSEARDSISFKDFLPFEIKAKQGDVISEQTAIIVMNAMKAGQMPCRVQQAILDVPELYETICQQEERAENGKATLNQNNYYGNPS